MSYSSYRNEVAKSSPTTRSGSRWWVIFLVLAALALLFGWLLMGVYAYYRLDGPIAPNVSVGDTPIGGLSIEQAAAVIDNEWNRDRILLVGDGSHYWQANPLEFGLWVDPNASARRAFEYGRGERRFSEIMQILTGVQPNEIQPVVVFSPQVAASQLSHWGPLVERPPEPATLQFVNGQWSAVPGAPGARYDAEATLKGMADNSALIMMSGYLPLVTQPVSSPVDTLNQKITGLEAQLNQPLLVHAYDPIADDTLEWRVPRETLGSWMRVEASNDDLSIQIDESGFAAYLASLEAGLDGGRSFEPVEPPYQLNERWRDGQAFTVIIHHAPTTYTVQAGDTLLKISYRTGIPLWMIVEANPGSGVNTINTGQTLTIPSRSDLLPLPVVPNKRIVISISQQRMRIYENGSQINEFVISTGVDRSPTQPGIFQIQTHELSAYASVWDLTMPHFLGIYEAWPGFMNGIHGLPTLSSGVRLWESILGKPASYGCIILKLDTAEWLYNWAENGVVVEIQA